MIATLLIAAAYALPALLARKRKIGTGKAVLMSILLSPFIALPLVLASKKRPAAVSGSGKARELDDSKKSVREKTGEDMSGYGYKEVGESLATPSFCPRPTTRSLEGRRCLRRGGIAFLLPESQRAGRCICNPVCPILMRKNHTIFFED